MYFCELEANLVYMEFQASLGSKVRPYLKREGKGT